MLEDLHALERAPLALQELSHTLDALDEAGGAVAVSARVGPGQWSSWGWPARLVNRLVGGLAVRVDPPGLAARRRYLLERARAQGIGLAAGAVDSLAEAADGYRTLDGWLANLALTSRVERRPLDQGLVDPLLAEDATDPAVTLEQIVRAVAAKFGVRPRDLRSSTRRQTVAEPRHLAMYLARNLTGLSFQSIGAAFGGRDPATVRHACKAAAARRRHPGPELPAGLGRPGVGRSRVAAPGRTTVIPARSSRGGDRRMTVPPVPGSPVEARWFGTGRNAASGRGSTSRPPHSAAREFF